MIEPIIITSRQNRLYKTFLSIKKRKLSNFCLIEGERLVRDLYIEAQFSAASPYLFISASYYTKKQSVISALLADIQLLGQKRPELYLLTDDLYAQLANTVQSQGIIAVLDIKKLQAIQDELLSQQICEPSMLQMLPDCKVAQREIILVLDQVQDPGNLGNIIRTCAAFGVKHIYCLSGTVHAWQDKVLRSAMGGIFKLQISENCQTAELFPQLKAAGYKLLSASLSEQNLYEYLAANTTDKLPKTALIVGNEGNGVSKQCLEASNAILTIPMLAQSESLNVAAATAICLSELRFH